MFTNFTVNLSIITCKKAEEIAHQAEDMARQAWLAGRTLMHHHHLPQWMRDNDFLLKGHRPQLNSFCACFKSIFSIHTETGNIWTHLLGQTPLLLN